MDKKQPIIVTGLSGAGLSTVLKSLEDFGYETIENLPPHLVPEILDAPSPTGQPIAIGLYARSRNFDTQTIQELINKYEAKLVFVTCDNNILLKRFTETRRRHPLAKDRPIHFGIDEERTALAPLQNKADITIDSSELSIHDLRHILEGHFKPKDKQDLIISIMSFGFKHGIPREADIIMDVRFLQNPHWVTELKPLSGKDKEVGDYIQKDQEFDTFIESFKTMLEPLLPRYAHEGKSYLTIAIGCTGGRHRSVFTVETLGHWLKTLNPQTHIEHRDLDN